MIFRINLTIRLQDSMDYKYFIFKQYLQVENEYIPVFF